VASVANGNPMTLEDFVSRPGKGELWLESGGDVAALDVANARLTPIPIPQAVATTINVRPSADQAVVGDGTVASIYRIAMTDHTFEPKIQLPSPFGKLTANPHDFGTVTTIPRFAPQSAFDPAYHRDAADERVLVRTIAE
jgi:hypothetical protein